MNPYLDDDMKNPLLAQYLGQAGHDVQMPAEIDFLSLLVHHENADSLFVEVNADVLHGASPFVET